MRRTALLVSTHVLCLLSGGAFLYLRPPPADLGKGPEAPPKQEEHQAKDPIEAEGARIAAQAIAQARGDLPSYDHAEALRLANQMAPGEGEKRATARANLVRRLKNGPRAILIEEFQKP